MPVNDSDATKYTVTAESGVERRHITAVRRAMAWLFSKEAQGIGQELARAAYANHQEPMQIILSNAESNRFAIGEGNKIYINLSYLQGAQFLGLDGNYYPMTVERLLAHEMTHAGQIPDMGTALLPDAMSRAQSAMWSSVPAEIGLLYEQKEQAIRTTKDFATANRLVYQLADDMIAWQAKHMIPFLQANADFESYARSYESPAIETENRVARLRNEPIKTTDYLTSMAFEHGNQRKVIAATLAEEMDLYTKDGAPQKPIMTRLNDKQIQLREQLKGFINSAATNHPYRVGGALGALGAASAAAVAAYTAPADKKISAAINVASETILPGSTTAGIDICKITGTVAGGVAGTVTAVAAGAAAFGTTAIPTTPVGAAVLSVVAGGTAYAGTQPLVKTGVEAGCEAVGSALKKLAVSFGGSEQAPQNSHKAAVADSNRAK